MQQEPRENIKISMPVLSPQAAYTLSNWLFELAHEIDFYYSDEIRSYQQWLDNEREGILQTSTNTFESADGNINF